MNLIEAKAMLPEIRLLLENLSEEWTVSYDIETGRSQVCECDPADGVVYPLATFEKNIPTDARELILKAPKLLHAAILLRDEAVRQYRLVAPQPGQQQKLAKPADFAAECAMKCDDPVFRRFLVEQHGLDASDRERVATRVRTMLAISSRSELNSNSEAAARWKSLRAEFEAWRIAA